MIFEETEFEGLYIIKIEKLIDERGYFARSWDEKDFEEKGLNSKLLQCNVSFNHNKGTLRGMHYQKEPYQEAKLIRCTKGKIFDVVIDLRINSKNFKKWLSFELNEENHKMLYVPEGFAHGFQTLEDNTEIFYQMTQKYKPNFASGIKWNDPIFNINWPIKKPILSEKDQKNSDFNQDNI
jgi:dTDP-4-dehydrorhamnose 3,5-epimerase